jgi:hypothetical protein
MPNSKLMEILNEPFADGWQATIEKKRKAILDLFKECVPKEKSGFAGYNVARQQMLSNIEKLEE